MTSSINIEQSKSEELKDLSNILSPYIKKIIKNALFITRIPEPNEAISYKKMSLWLDDIARFVTMTSTFSHTHLKSDKYSNLKKEIQLTNHKIVIELEKLTKVLKDDEKAIPEFVETNIIPLITKWNNHIAPNCKSVINELK